MAAISSTLSVILAVLVLISGAISGIAISRNIAASLIACAMNVAFAAIASAAGLVGYATYHILYFNPI